MWSRRREGLGEEELEEEIVAERARRARARIKELKGMAKDLDRVLLRLRDFIEEKAQEGSIPNEVADKVFDYLEKLGEKVTDVLLRLRDLEEELLL